MKGIDGKEGWGWLQIPYQYYNQKAICADYIYRKQKIILNSETFIKNFVTGWADKKPFGDTALFFEHRVKTIFVSTRRANLKLFFHLNIFNFVIHTISSLKSIDSDYIYHKNEKGKPCETDLPLLKNDITNNLGSQKPVIYSRYR